MSNKIGVLGEVSLTTVGTQTAYTVPTGKAAKIKIMYRGTAGVNSTLSLIINGLVVFLTGALTSGNISHTDTTRMHVSQAASAISGGTDQTTVAPGPKEYYLSAGDTVQYAIGTADFSAMSFQVVGTEVDV